MAALVTQGSSLDWSYLQDLWTMAMCKYTAVPIKDVGVWNILYIARVGGCCLVCYFSLLLGLLLFFPPTFFYLLFHSFIHIHPSPLLCRQILFCGGVQSRYLGLLNLLVGVRLWLI